MMQDERPERAAAEVGRGREAVRPRELTLAAWRDILLRTKEEVANDHISIVAAGMAFYALLALFPGIAALIAIWALAFDPGEIEQQVLAASEMMPDEAAEIVMGQARQVASGAGGGLTLAAIFGLLLAVYSATKGTKAMIEGLNIVYGERERRGIVKLNLAAILMTFCGIVGTVLVLALVAGLPAMLGSLGLGSTAEMLLSWVRWPILFVFALFGLAIIYRVGPSRADARWRWVNWGAILATVFWIIASAGFSLYVRYFGSYNETYGSLGAVIVLLMWFWLSGYIVLLGAELNAQMEHQTLRDSTTGRPKPMGERGARVADTVARKP